MLKVGAVALAAGAVVALLAAPAAAAPAIDKLAKPGCVGTLLYDNIQAQIDNCPGGGHNSWAWLWVPSGKGNAITGWLTAADVNLDLANGTTLSFTVFAGNTDTRYSDSSRITAIQACEEFLTFNGLYTWQCGIHHAVPQS